MTRLVRAYALLVFDDKGKTLLGWSVFSNDEGSITCYGGRRYARITHALGGSYVEARAAAVEAVRTWMPGLGEPMESL